MNLTAPAPLTTQLLSTESKGDVELAAALLRAGRLVAMPTETVYGLAANALDPAAVHGIFEAKKRPGWDPLIVHVSDETMLARIVREISPTARRLMEAFWPGPLTLLLPRGAEVPDAVTAGRDLVGVRMPAHPAALALIRAAGLPLAAPSANLFGHISPTTADHVLADLRGRIHAVLDAGPCAIGVESTVLDPNAMVLYRQGGVSAADVERVAGQLVNIYQPPAVEHSAPESLPSPGVGIRHYAPRARLLLVLSEEDMRSVLAAADAAATGAMLPTGWLPEWRGKTFGWGNWTNPAELARTLYQGLRSLDDGAIETIVCPLPASSGETLVEALRDRLQKAARAA
ncbi:MAG: L-threonylcarbamoyladenylate synthase [Janthinobacterium lividum]